MSQYIFEANRDDQELRRLRLIEQALDEDTIALLRRGGADAARRCLEVGAGAGSITRWLGDRVGAGGQVVAVDRNTAHLQHLSGPPYQLLQGDFLDLPLGWEFDLAHCRYVLIHNRDSQAILKKLGAVLRAGGRLVVEEPDFTSARLLNHGGDPSQQRVNDAICRMFEQLGLDPGYGLSLPAKVAAEGLQVLQVDARLHLNRGGDTMARMMAESTQALRDRYVATGEAGPADVEQYVANANREQFWAVYYATVSVIATKATDTAAG